MFHVGQKVVCVDGSDNADDFEDTFEGPYVGDICTVSNVYSVGNDVMLELFEFPAPETERHFAGFWAADFRPVVSRKTDISIFTRILDEENRKAMETTTASNRAVSSR